MSATLPRHLCAITCETYPGLTIIGAHPQNALQIKQSLMQMYYEVLNW